MIKHAVIGLALMLTIAPGFGQGANANTATKELLRLADLGLQEASDQYLLLASHVADTAFPKTLQKDGSLAVSNSKWWCSGFYPGTLLYLCQYKKNDSLYQEALRKLRILEKEQYNKGTHDLGFMMYCSYGNALKLGPNDEYKKILIKSAQSLSTRFSPVTGCIRSWNSKKPNDYIVIIDNMMNLELLFYATRVTGDSSFYRIAVTHADNTLKNHFRPDYSSWHVVDYNPQTGAVDNKRTHQGANDSSAWARGQGWALYGYTLMYRETRDKKYLEQANHIADFILHHPNLPADKIPYWDFNAPGIPDVPRDASAGALMASALLELSGYNKAGKSDEYMRAAEYMIRSLSGNTYKSAREENQGFLLKHSVGSLPHKSEVDVPISYADYYYVEALLRYRALATGKKLFAMN